MHGQDAKNAVNMKAFQRPVTLGTTSTSVHVHVLYMYHLLQISQGGYTSLQRATFDGLIPSRYYEKESYLTQQEFVSTRQLISIMFIGGVSLLFASMGDDASSSKMLNRTN